MNNIFQLLIKLSLELRTMDKKLSLQLTIVLTRHTYVVHIYFQSLYQTNYNGSN